jgi:hypothetical protein
MLNDGMSLVYYKGQWGKVVEYNGMSYTLELFPSPFQLAHDPDFPTGKSVGRVGGEKITCVDAHEFEQVPEHIAKSLLKWIGEAA